MKRQATGRTFVEILVTWNTQFCSDAWVASRRMGLSQAAARRTEVRKMCGIAGIVDLQGQRLIVRVHRVVQFLDVGFTGGLQLIARLLPFVLGDV